MNKLMKYLADVNRTALIVRIKKPFIDWIKYIDPAVDFLEEKHDSKTVYLLPEGSDNGRWERYLKKNFNTIFEQELEAWFTDPKLWSKDRSWKVFNEWLDYEMHSIIFDTVNEPIEKE